jgi:cytochrome c oxidase subunit 2
MKRSETLARILIPVSILVAIGAPLFIWSRTPLIHAHIAENGGWSPDVLQAKVGEPLHLHLTSDDVTHGFAVGQMDMQSVDVLPGKVTDVTLIFDKPGTYTFYCTRWCGINHWRMRGTIEVTGPGSDSPASVSPPLYVTLGLNIDAPHPASVIPVEKPSAIRGTFVAAPLLQSYLNQKYLTPEYYRGHSPAQAFTDLRADPALQSLTDPEVWDLVAYLWQSNLTPIELAYGRRLYAQNCAACHGETMEGNGVFAEKLAAAGQNSSADMAGAQNQTIKKPANLSDPLSMDGASPALLEGKIIRGGMGTGMPSWGPIFTAEQIKSIVGYLYTCMFDYANSWIPIR